MATLAPSVVIGSSSLLQATRTTINSRMNSILLHFGVSFPLATKIPYTYDGRNVMATRAPYFNWIFFILAGNEDNHKISHELDFGPDITFTGEY